LLGGSSVILSEQLDELRNNILFDRGTSTADNDKLWSDATLVRYINDAQRRFAVRGLVLRDSTTPAVVNVTLVSGQTEYTLHPSIISVISARNDDSTADLIRFGHSAFGSYSNPSTMIWDPGAINWPTGRALAYSTDEQFDEDDDGSRAAVVLRVYPEPDASNAGDIIKLRVIRKPLTDLTVADLTVTPEIPVDHHLEMLDWAAYLALRIMDVDAGNVVRAEAFRLSFERSVKEARSLVLKKMFVPQQWGFGAGGWSWGASNGW
jgi:hypothetical protein